ncbi:E3 ubiquitin ligase SCF complex, Skp subunit [Neocallimastix lanati (nom. inval.)]|uniref:E3 ubiquitin ligase complex SCF subunit n=1 Tax=Neocallimastix californiae TaxID=1754190 RepID=A0A1Y2DRZ6_9FUNG|nr:E3 ubiquitin ligase SCF complex, Skp subunit [Neocallimastix sp. JGI-2020a]ORY62040.1 E3 ubiquitin ligase SCF complex, Skp subunit [Neocallimastix californiae]|eukprot:ORY62040.1 E3 ubiquitin ligase SCF complex, Skp subunit [Neocallimastix californiae]
MDIQVNLESKDGRVFTVDKEVAIKSKLLNDLLEDVDEDNNENIPLLTITGNILEKVIEYCEYHRNDNTDEYGHNYYENNDNWDTEYLERFTKKDLFDTALAADFLDIKNLLNLTCRRIASNFRGKTVERILEYLGNDEENGVQEMSE